MPLHVPTGDVRSPIYLLTVTVEREVVRYASAPVTVPSDDGDLDYRGGLTVEGVEEVLDVLVPVQAVRSVPLVVAWARGLTGAVADGVSLIRLGAELAVIADGDAWEERRVLLSGTLVDPVDDVDGTLAATLYEDALDDAGQLLEPAAVVQRDVTWDYPDASSEGAPYPKVFGAPGVYVDPYGEVQSCPGSPMPQVYQQAGADILLAAGHPVDASSVTIHNATQETTVTPTAFTREGDLLERRVTTATVGISDVLSGDDCWAAWTDGDAHPGLSRAGALLRHVLSRSTVPVDWQRLEVAAPDLDRWVVAGYIDEDGPPMRWVEDNLLPILPVTMAHGPEGWYPAVWQWDAPRGAAVADLVEGRTFTREGPRAWEGGEDLRTEIALSYALDGAAREYRRTLIATGDPARVGSVGYIHTEQLRRAWTRWGRRGLALSTDVLCSDASAGLTLSWLAFRHTTRRGVVAGELSRRLWHVRVGDLVTYTDAGLQLSSVPAYVRRLRWSGGTVRAELWMSA